VEGKPASISLLQLFCNFLLSSCFRLTLSTHELVKLNSADKMTTPIIELNGSTPLKTQQTTIPQTQPTVYGKISLQLTNCLLPEEKLSPTPSEVDGLDKDTETDLRILGCELIQTAGMLLKLPQVRLIFLILEIASLKCTNIYEIRPPFEGFLII
jgi:hypothetical protein